VFRLAKERGVTVLLDGQGGDELLGGYEQYFERYLASLPGERAAAERRQIEARYPLALLTTRQRLGRALPRPLAHAIAGMSGLGSDAAFGLDWEVARRVHEPAEVSHPTRFHPLADALHRDMTSRILPVLLRYGDRNSMAHSREVRLPFCDHRLAEFVFSLAPERLMGGAETKRLLRGAMIGAIPESIRTRWNKQGFLPPHAEWFRGSLGPIVRAIIEAPEFTQSGLWRPTWWRKVLARFDRGDDHLSALLWRPFIEHAWRTHFVERVRRQPVLPIFADGA
jgi:asparagine synthase (glutamine-hydrolysing)